MNWTASTMTNRRPLGWAAKRMMTLALAAAPAVALAETSLPEPGVPQSVGVQLKTHNFTVEAIDTVGDMGFRAIRRGVYWDAVETEKGKYDFSAYDEQFNHAKQKGYRVVACLFGNNTLHEDDGRGGIQTEAGRADFAAFAAAAAEHYKDHDLLWEIWNEPNVRTFWRKDGMHNSDPFAQEYTDLVKAVAPAMLKADPGAFIMAGSVSNYWQPSYEWTEACFKKGILQSGIRGWSVHPYGVKSPEEFAIGHGKTRALLKQYGAPDMPMINTERGFAIKKPQGQLEQEGWSGGELERLRDYQAAHFVRQFMIDQLHGLPLTVWYELDGDEFGIVGKDGIRPIETAARFMNQRLAGYRLDRRIETDNPQDYLLLWKDEAGNRQLIAWTSPPAGGTPDEARPHEVSIQTAAGARFDLADLNGKASTLDQLKLTLTAMPQYVALPKGVELGAITTAAPAPLAVSSGPAADGLDLQLMADGDAWKFIKNTGEGSFTVTNEGGDAIGVLQYDFTASQSKSTPYVLAQRPVKIAAAEQISLDVRSTIAQPLTFRVVDSTGQTLQLKHRIKGAGQWENIRIPLNRKLEHWGGANDGKVHFPIEQILLSVPRPSETQLAGKLEYAHFIAVGADNAGAQGTATDAATPAAAAVGGVPAAPAAEGGAIGAGDLKLFETPTEWTFSENTGKGSIELSRDGDKPIAILHYDFTNSQARSTPYVLAAVPTAIAEAQAVEVSARASRQQRITLRLVDSTGQTHQFKGSVKGTGDWEKIRIPLNRRLEHWDGAADGKIHFPITQLVLSIPQPVGDPATGKIEFADAAVVGR